MKIKSSVLLGFVVLVCLLGGLSLMNRMDVEQDVWRPADMYSSVGGAHNSTYSSVSYTSGASEATAVPVVSNAGSLFRHRTVSSYAPAHRSPMANSQYSIGGTPSYSSKGASALYTTSSATMKSFGNGGMGAGVAMSGGSVRATSSQPATMAAVVSMPSLPTPAFSSTSSAARSSVSMEQLLASGDYLAAASYQGVGSSAGGYRGIGGRRNAPPGLGGSDDVGGSWLQWLYEQFGTGNHQFTEEQLRALYDQYIASHSGGSGIWDDMPTWEDWLAWFTEDEDGYEYEDGHFSMLPVGEVWVMLVFAVIYTAYVVVRKRKRVEV